MEIKTKFNFGQRVQAIVLRFEQYKEICPICEGEGHFLYKNRIIDCQEPGCWGEGYITKTKSKQWYVPKDEKSEWSNFVIQKIVVELYDPNNKKLSGNKSRICYAFDSSGTMWDENDCFASIEEAQKECDIRNQNLEK